MSETIVDIKIGEQSLQKGEVREGKQLIAWDCVQACDPERCPIGVKCIYAAKSSGKKCTVQVDYLQSFVNTIFTTYRFLDEGDMFRIGMHLVPLYSQLCRQKIVELSVGNLTYEDAKGVTRIHPIYKELRETIKLIAVLWKDMGFRPETNPALPPVFQNGREGFGDPHHYTTISQGADNKRDVIR